MPKITYIDPDGAEHTLNLPVGQTLMRGAKQNNIPGIVATCGGACCCATCHVYIPEDYLTLIDPITEDEQDMLTMAVAPVTNRSRLSCQVHVTEDLDGITIEIAPRQD